MNIPYNDLRLHGIVLIGVACFVMYKYRNKDFKTKPFYRHAVDECAGIYNSFSKNPPLGKGDYLIAEKQINRFRVKYANKGNNEFQQLMRDLCVTLQHHLDEVKSFKD